MQTWNPIRINLNHLWLLTRDAWRAESWWDKCRIWFMPTGWRPADVKAKYPVASADPKNFIKYNTPASKTLTTWSWTQFGILLFMVFHLLYKIVEIGTPGVFIYGGFMFLMVYSYTTLMDRDSNAIWMEAVKSVLGLLIIFISGSWFGLDQMIPGGTILIAAYFVLSALVVAYFVMKEIGWDGVGTQSAERIEG